MNQTNREKPLFIYDGNCGFCKFWVERWKHKVGNEVEFCPYQKIHKNFKNISKKDFQKSSKIVLPNKEIKEGAEGIFELFSYKDGVSWGKFIYQYIPGFSLISEKIYKLISKNRNLFAKLTHLLWGDKTKPSSYSTSTWIFQKLIAIIYGIAFLSLLTQITGLIGTNGILPVNKFLHSVQESTSGLMTYLKAPTILWLSPTNSLLIILGSLGIIFSLLLFLNIIPLIAALMAWFLYLSITVGGQEFFAYQWDILLLEAGFLTLFIVPKTININPKKIKNKFFETKKNNFAAIFLFWWLVFRVMFESGLVKIASQDITWRNLSALSYHYFTQPIPNLLSWFFYQLPNWFHKISTFITHITELVVPFLFFAPRKLRFLGGVITIAFQLMIFITGNYTFFNVLTVALALMLFDNEFWSKILKKYKFTTKYIHKKLHTKSVSSKSQKRFAQVFLLLVLIISFGQIFSLITQSQLPKKLTKIKKPIANFRIINQYGLFANMTTKRPELIIEYSYNGNQWKEYDFRYKPDKLSEIPPQIAPHQPRLDWQMWFSALTAYHSTLASKPQYDRWFIHFTKKLLQGSKSVEKLIKWKKKNAPNYIRVKLYQYKFTTPKEKQRTGNWWKRKLVGTYLPPVTIKKGKLIKARNKKLK
ncbi:MAG: lipase maturation factor family protein [Candidatus Magasanikbacteria bacterium]